MDEMFEIFDIVRQHVDRSYKQLFLNSKYEYITYIYTPLIIMDTKILVLNYLITVVP